MKIKYSIKKLSFPKDFEWTEDWRSNRTDSRIRQREFKVFGNEGILATYEVKTQQRVVTVMASISPLDVSIDTSKHSNIKDTQRAAEAELSRHLLKIQK